MEKPSAELINRIDSNSKYIAEVCDDVVNKSCSEMDAFMLKIREFLVDITDNPLSDEDLEIALLKISSIIYAVYDHLEKVGIKNDVAEMVRKDLYNRWLMEAEGTIADKTSKAEAATIEERIMTVVYQRAYNRIRNKIQSCVEMQSTLKKLLSRRMVELDNYKYGGSRGE